MKKSLSRKIIIAASSLLVVILLIVIYVGVISNSKSNSMVKNDTSELQTTNQTQSDVKISTTQNDTSATERTTDTPTVSIEWTYKSFEWEDSDGFKYEITYKISPWILLSNTNIVNSVWKDVGNGNALPAFDDWGLKRGSDNYYYRSNIQRGGTTSNFGERMTDMYYCIGTISIKNITNNWDITSENPRSFYMSLGHYRYDYKSYGDTAQSIGRSFYSNETVDECDAVIINPEMIKNEWGPNTFILMAPENITPSNPEGEYKNSIISGGLEFSANISAYNSAHRRVGESSYVSNDFQIGIIGKDGEYVAP